MSQNLLSAAVVIGALRVKEGFSVFTISNKAYKLRMFWYIPSAFITVCEIIVAMLN